MTLNFHFTCLACYCSSSFWSCSLCFFSIKLIHAMYSIMHITSNKEHTWSAKKYHGKCLQLEKATQTANIVSLCTCNLLMYSTTICLKCWVWFCYSCTRRSRTWTVSKAKISRKTCKHVDFSCMHGMYSVSYTMQQAFRYTQYTWGTFFFHFSFYSSSSNNNSKILTESAPE